MNSTTFHTHTTANYAANVAYAARQLFAALFARKPAAVAEATTERADETIWWLSSTAKDVEAHSPNLAAELRYIAARFG